MVLVSEHQAKLQGFQAFYQGKTVKDNPFPMVSGQYYLRAAWSNGFGEAKDLELFNMGKRR